MSVSIQMPCIVILAAGMSARMGEAKQLLPFRGKNLLLHAVDTALESRLGPVLVVTGSAHDTLAAVLLQRPAVEIIQNPDWPEGMASSIRSGLLQVREEYPQADGMLLMVCDQPAVDPGILRSLLEKQLTTGKPIVASAYAGVLGTPVLFHHSLFTELAGLKGDAGARRLLSLYPDKTVSISFEAGIGDIDTPADYHTLIEQEQARKL